MIKLAAGRGQLRIALAIAAVPLLLSAGASAQVPFTSAQGGYSVSFPAEPRETVETKPDAKIFSYIVRQNDAVYGSSHVDYNSDLDAEQELQANAQNFADALKAPVTSRRGHGSRQPRGLAVSADSRVGRAGSGCGGGGWPAYRIEVPAGRCDCSSGAAGPVIAASAWPGSPAGIAWLYQRRAWPALPCRPSGTIAGSGAARYG